MLIAFVAVPVLAEEQTQTVAGPFTYRIKMPAGYRIPVHSHKARENVTVLSGVVSVGFGEKFDESRGQQLGTGGFVSVPARRAHYGWAGGQETIVQVHGVGPTDLTLMK